MKKKLMIFIFMFVSLFVFESVSADSCTDCANAGTPCGLCGYSCALNKDNICVTNETFGIPEKEQDLGGCSGYTYKESCQGNDFYSCVWNKNQFGEYCNTDKLVYVRCGDSFDIPHEAPKIISFIIALLKVAIPIILIFVAVLSLLKAVGASNEDEIKKAQKSLVRKIASAVLAFFVITIVQFVIMKVADSADANDISSCLSCFMNNDCDGVAYYKTNVGGTYLCTELGGSKSTFTCPGNS